MDYNDEGNDNYDQDYESQDNYSIFDFKDSCHADVSHRKQLNFHRRLIILLLLVSKLLTSFFLGISLRISRKKTIISQYANINIVFGVSNAVPIYKDYSDSLVACHTLYRK